MNNKLVKDYLGNLIPKAKARKILGRYYVEGESCFLMEDDQWYRKTSSDKIIYDNYKKKYVLKSSSGNFLSGVINEKGETGRFSENDSVVMLVEPKSHNKVYCLNEEIALKLGYEEAISDGLFYNNIKDTDRVEWMNKKTIPNSERSKSYNLESDQARKKELQTIYEELSLQISPNSKILSKFLGDFTYGFEWEVINGFIPKRIRSKYGIKALKDGSLRDDKGEGIEYVSMPMSGAKGIQLVREVTKELSKRCDINNYCSMHIHFGNVRKDKLYVLSLFRLITMIQNELALYFPWSRTHSIKADNKVYCKALPNLSIRFNEILNQKDEEDFHEIVVTEFNKIYTWLNAGKGLAEEFDKKTFKRETVVTSSGKKMFIDKWLRNIYTTKNDYHSIQGEKWNRESRYYNFNLLNLFFTKLHTVEARIHEGTTNSTKCIIWLLTVASILKYAEKIQTCLTSKSITLTEILEHHLNDKYARYIMAYYEDRKTTFKVDTIKSKEEAAKIEDKWFKSDAAYRFIDSNTEIK